MKINTRQLFSVKDPTGFEHTALAIFRYQAAACKVYNHFLSNLKVNINAIKKIQDIPFLPVSFFKTHDVCASDDQVSVTFSSSATTGMVQSRHLVTDVKLYEESYLRGFEHFYGKISDYCILALLPAYQEREGSSLIYMVDDLINQSNHPKSGYFLHNNAALAAALTDLKVAGQKTILIGVTYALLDFVEEFKPDFPNLIVMETGGMKGKRKEMIREELHQVLCNGFGVKKIHSEYGMTELLSQAYSKGNGIFNCPAWMSVMVRDINDPFSVVNPGKTGGINVIDLANLNSCSFIATQDLGRLYDDGSFEVLGRFDNADIRGCNLLVQ